MGMKRYICTVAHALPDTLSLHKPNVECSQAHVGCHGIEYNSSLLLQPRLVQAQGLQVTVLPQEEGCKTFQGLCSYTVGIGTMILFDHY